MNEIHIKESDAVGFITVGRQYDHKSTKVIFDDLWAGVDYSLLISLDGLHYMIVPLENNEWVISNSFTQRAGAFIVQVCSQDSEGNLVKHTPVYRLYIDKSIDHSDIEQEIVPEQFQSAYDRMLAVTDNIAGMEFYIENRIMKLRWGNGTVQELGYVGGGGGGVDFTTDHTLTLDENHVLKVNTANDAEQDNTLPITSAAVYTQVGNINALLNTI